MVFLSNLYSLFFGEDTLAQVQKNPNDENAIKRRLFIEKKAKEIIDSESGLDRLKKVFIIEDYHLVHPILNHIFNTAYVSGVVTLTLASIFGTKNASRVFKQKNVSKVYEHRFFANRAHMDAMAFGGLRNGVRWTIKVVPFVLVCQTICQSVSLYRNKSGIVEYLTSGAIACSLYRINLGLRGITSGFVIGSILGLIAGFVSLPILKYSNQTQDIIYYDYLCKELENKFYCDIN